MRGTKTRAALLVAQGKLTEVEIARACQISDRQLRRWKQDPEFRVEVARHHRERQRRLDAWRDRILDVDIADRSKRILRLDDDQKALDQIRTEPGVDGSPPTSSANPRNVTEMRRPVRLREGGTSCVQARLVS
jgi:hypothetical protein